MILGLSPYCSRIPYGDCNEIQSISHIERSKMHGVWIELGVTLPFHFADAGHASAKRIVREPK